MASRRRSAGNGRRGGVTIVVFSGDLDRLTAALVIATGAAAMGMPASLFFTFWGLAAVRRAGNGRRTRGRRSAAGRGARRDPVGRAFARLVPSGLGAMGLSRLNFGGAGGRLLRARMRSRGVATPEALLEEARGAGVRLVACGMSMEVLGLSADELLDGVEVGGVATFLADASGARVTLFV